MYISATAPIFGINAHGLISELDRNAVKMTSYTEEEVTGRHLVHGFIIDECKAPVNAMPQKALQGIEKDNFEFPFISKSSDTG